MNDEDGLSWDETVFRQEHIFEVDYIPEAFLHRAAQLQSIQYALRPAVRGSRPLNVFAHGPPGTGKTTAIQKLFDELTTQNDIIAVRINCQVDSTRYAVFSRILESLLDYEPPEPGIQFKQLFRKITNHLNQQEKVLIVALDDVNYLFYENEASDSLYSLLRAHEIQEDAKIGVITVSSDPSLEVIDALDSRVQSVFRPEEVFFPPYDMSEIIDILTERVERGFRDGAVSDEVLKRAAERTGETGDLRVGIDLLRRAGLNAEMRASRTLNVDDVEKAYDASKYVHLARRLETLSDTECALVKVLIDEGRDRAGELFDAFQERTGLGYTRYSEIVNKLDNLGIIEATYTTVDGRGRSREIELAYDSDAISSRLE